MNDSVIDLLNAIEYNNNYIKKGKCMTMYNMGVGNNCRISIESELWTIINDPGAQDPFKDVSIAQSYHVQLFEDGKFCGMFNLNETEADLTDLHDLMINNAEPKEVYLHITSKNIGLKEFLINKSETFKKTALQDKLSFDLQCKQGSKKLKI